MMKAAEVTTLPVPARPRATDSVLSPVRTYSSRTRDSRTAAGAGSAAAIALNADLVDEDVHIATDEESR
jgi:hypothetical protein